ncbi:hypothetical protein BDZ89DRAFT_1142898 [Hymenopellis radicata]|nr:hypothetical protein BDZ89DRAFT_1142898 [Hymenopellis radicata]
MSVVKAGSSLLGIEFRILLMSRARVATDRDEYLQMNWQRLSVENGTLNVIVCGDSAKDVLCSIYKETLKKMNRCITDSSCAPSSAMSTTSSHF